MMGELELMQLRFVEDLNNPQWPAPRHLNVRSGSVARRFDVYRRNVYAGLTGVLEGRFPAVRRIVGEEFFAGFARQFVEQHPPRSPALVFYGEAFPGYIRSATECDDVPYLADVAAIEWEIHRCYHAADGELLKAADLARVMTEAADLKFRFAVSSAVVSSAYPAYSIWRMNAAADAPGPIVLTKAGETALVTRRGLHCDVVPLPPGGGTFAWRLAAGLTLAEAFAAASEDDCSFRIDQVLGLMIRQGAFAACSAQEVIGRSS